MIAILAAAATLAQANPSGPVAAPATASAQARASVRIVRGSEIRFGKPPRRPRESIVRNAPNGVSELAKLVEFE